MRMIFCYAYKLARLLKTPTASSSIKISQFILAPRLPSDFQTILKLLKIR